VGGNDLVRVTVDYQLLFNSAVALAAFLGGWILNSITGNVKRLALDVRELDKEHRKTREDYVAKVDYKADLQEISHRFDKIDDKLDLIARSVGHGPAIA
jgi:hypothetical protein